VVFTTTPLFPLASGFAVSWHAYLLPTTNTYSCLDLPVRIIVPVTRT